MLFVLLSFFQFFFYHLRCCCYSCCYIHAYICTATAFAFILAASLTFINIFFIYIAVVIIIFSFLSSLCASHILLLHMNFAENTKTYWDLLLSTMLQRTSCGNSQTVSFLRMHVCMYVRSLVYIWYKYVLYLYVSIDVHVFVYFVILVAAVIWGYVKCLYIC